MRILTGKRLVMNLQEVENAIKPNPLKIWDKICTTIFY